MTVVVHAIYYHFKVAICHVKRLLFPCKRQKEQGTMFNWNVKCLPKYLVQWLTIVHFRLSFSDGGKMYSELALGLKHHLSFLKVSYVSHRCTNCLVWDSRMSFLGAPI